MPFLSPNQQCQSTEGKISHPMDLLTPNSPGVFQLCLWPLWKNSLLNIRWRYQYGCVMAVARATMMTGWIEINQTCINVRSEWVRKREERERERERERDRQTDRQTETEWEVYIWHIGHLVSNIHCCIIENGTSLSNCMQLLKN